MFCIMKKELSIVLRPLSTTSDVVLMTREYGKIRIIARPFFRFQQLVVGTLVAGSFKNAERKKFAFQNLEVVIYPLCSTLDDLHWFHQIIELCYYFLPENQMNSPVFDYLYHVLMLFLHNQIVVQYALVVRKVGLLKLLFLLGFHPEKNFVRYLDLFDQVVRASVDLQNQSKVSSVIRALGQCNKIHMEYIDEWMMRCVNDHPSGHLFKTMSLR